MKTSLKTIQTYLKQETIKIYEWFCIGMLISFFFWPLLNSILCICLSVYWFLFVSKRRISSGKARMVLLFISPYLLTILGIFQSTNYLTGLAQLQLKLPLLMFPIVFGYGPFLEPTIIGRIRKAFGYSVFAAGMLCLLNGVYQYITRGTTEQLHGYSMVIIPDMYPYILGIACVLAYAFWVIDLTKNSIQSNSERIWGAVLLLFFCLLILLIGNRNVLLCWVLVNVFIVVYRIKSLVHRFLSLLFFIIVVLLSMVLNPSLKRQIKDLTDQSAGNTIALDQDSSLGRSWGGKALRMAIWKCSWDIVKTNYWVGVGTGNEQDALQMAYEKRKFYFASRYNHYNAHNQYLQETIAHGIPGLAVLLVALLLPFWIYRSTPHYTIYALCLFCFSIIFFTESVLEINKGLVLYSFLNSIFAFTSKNTPAL